MHLFLPYFAERLPNDSFIFPSLHDANNKSKVNSTNECIIQYIDQTYNIYII